MPAFRRNCFFSGTWLRVLLSPEWREAARLLPEQDRITVDRGALWRDILATRFDDSKNDPQPPLTVARLLNNRGTIERSAGLADRAEATFGEARRAARQAGDPLPLLVSWMGMVTVALLRRDLGRAQWYARRCLGPARRAGLLSLAAQTQGNLGLALLQAGRRADAATEFHQALEVFRRLDDQRFIEFTERNLAECRRRRKSPLTAHDPETTGTARPGKETKRPCGGTERPDQNH